jgi:hypothetical protein
LQDEKFRPGLKGAASLICKIYYRCVGIALKLLYQKNQNKRIADESKRDCSRRKELCEGALNKYGRAASRDFSNAN